MKQIYTPEGIERLKRRTKSATCAAIAAAGIGLALCVTLCFGIRTKNAEARQIAVIVISSLTAWTAATLLTRVRLPLLREAAHEEGVLREPAQLVEGTIVEVSAAHPIPKSITFQPITLRTESGEISLKLNAAFAGSFPSQGQFLRTETHRGYLTAWETLGAPANDGYVYSAVPHTEPGKAAHPQKSGTLEAFNEARQSTSTIDRPRLPKPLPRLSHGLACILLSALLWSWIFTFLTDTAPANKIVLYADMKTFSAKELAVALEENAPADIRFVQVHPFSYALMDSSALERADLYVMTEKQLEEYADWVVLDTSWLLYDAEKGTSVATQYLNYEDQPGENWYLYLGAQSIHAGAQDTAALEVAQSLLSLP